MRMGPCRRMCGAGAAGVFAAVLVAAAPASAADQPAAARVIIVSSISQLQAAADQAQPGDRIELVDGVYITSGPIQLTRSGTSTAPITIAAQHVGKAEIDGPDYVAVEGFRLTHAAGVTIPAGANHTRLTRNVIQISSSSTTNWVTVVGDDAEISYNTFQHKSSVGVFLQISGPGSTAMAQRAWVHHNYFYDHSYGGSNGGESIRLGYSYRQLSSAYAVIEDNLFEQANGDAEAISVKSSDNTVRFNTIRNSRGSIVLRHGNRTLVEGNLMIGGSSGIRFYENDHVIINNLIQGGSGQIIAGSGTIIDDTTGGTEHARPDRVLVAFNTIAGNRTDLIDVGWGNHEYGPDDCTFANNILVGGGSGALVSIETGTNLHWQGNIVWAGTGGDMPSSGYRLVNPALVTDAGGLRRLSTTSPAIDTAAGSYPQVTRDMDLQPRPDAKDVGADEYAATGAQRRPLTTADVGPDASAPAPSNRYEAENAVIFHSAVESNHTGFSGTGFVNYDNEVGSYVEWTVNAASAGSATLTFRYANGTTTNRPMDVSVNGAAARTLDFPTTGSWDTWATAPTTVTLNAGSNTIRATATTADGGPNVDYLEVTAQPPGTPYEAEDAVCQGTVDSDHTGFSGTGFCNTTNAVGSYAEWTVTAASAGSATLTFRYANGTTVDRPMDIMANGGPAGQVAFPPTGSWDTWASTTLTTTLNAGTNTIRATATTVGGGPNLDYLEVVPQ